MLNILNAQPVTLKYTGTNTKNNYLYFQISDSEYSLVIHHVDNSSGKANALHHYNRKGYDGIYEASPAENTAVMRVFYGQVLPNIGNLQLNQYYGGSRPTQGFSPSVPQQFTYQASSNYNPQFYAPTQIPHISSAIPYQAWPNVNFPDSQNYTQHSSPPHQWGGQNNYFQSEDDSSDDQTQSPYVVDEKTKVHVMWDGEDFIFYNHFTNGLPNVIPHVEPKFRKEMIEKFEATHGPVSSAPKKENCSIM